MQRPVRSFGVLPLFDGLLPSPQYVVLLQYVVLPLLPQLPVAQWLLRWFDQWYAQWLLPWFDLLTTRLLFITHPSTVVDIVSAVE
ncbi:hypothetical protein HG15A2_02680 [Adhaeretor mobilis]|uniref:Uncharacterized protein n=1 Tax=Adhaeretor mobilis TaxID=1930276 RepID=A0A517MQ55_9BACT|nr:hypothetical protein HG15A2_02680 [Adhaeretor mobilis]